MRENAQAKAARLLVGGAVSVLEVTQHRCTASVKGDTATHAVTFDGSRWACDCAAVGPCSHALAVARIVEVRAELEHKGGDRVKASRCRQHHVQKSRFPGRNQSTAVGVNPTDFFEEGRFFPPDLYTATQQTP